jgi:hypothetical protein
MNGEGIVALCRDFFQPLIDYLTAPNLPPGEIRFLQVYIAGNRAEATPSFCTPTQVGSPGRTPYRMVRQRTILVIELPLEDSRLTAITTIQ